MRVHQAIGVAIGSALWLASPAAADDAQRIQELEGEVKELKGQLQEIKLLVRDLTSEQAPAEAVHNAHEAMDTGGFHGPSLSINGFADIQYDANWGHLDEGGNQDTNNYALGDLDLFLASQIAEKLSFLAENVFEFEEDGSVNVDVERLLLKYDYADWLRAAAGRGHTALGYWNHHFHHGSWMQTTVERPLLFAFEDEGGILPVHFVGLELSGNLDLGGSSLFYSAALANGRGDITDFVQNVEDQNQSKAFTSMVTLHPTGVEELGFGASAYIDRIPRNPGQPGRDEVIDEGIFGGHFNYTEYPWELLVEGQAIHHDSDAGDQWDAGAYAQIAYVVDRLKPYYRFDWLKINPNDPYYQGIPGVEDTRQHTLGLRIDWTTFTATKVELRRRDSNSFDAWEAAAQAAFAF